MPCSRGTTAVALRRLRIGNRPAHPAGAGAGPGSTRPSWSVPSGIRSVVSQRARRRRSTRPSRSGGAGPRRRRRPHDFEASSSTRTRAAPELGGGSDITCVNRRTARLDCLAVVAVHGVRRERGQADRHVGGAAGLGRGVAHPLAAAGRARPGRRARRAPRPRARRAGSPRARPCTRRSRGRWPGSTQPSGERMWATLTRSSPVLTRPTYSSISLGLVPAASTLEGFWISSGIERVYQ